MHNKGKGARGSRRGAVCYFWPTQERKNEKKVPQTVERERERINIFTQATPGDFNTDDYVTAVGLMHRSRD